MRELTIYKYLLEIADIQTIEMPKGAQVLTVQRQNNSIALWVLVDATLETEKRTFEILSTGKAFKEEKGVERKYISTFQVSNGIFVFHVFERISFIDNM
jgi:hypothetical protein